MGLAHLLHHLGDPLTLLIENDGTAVLDDRRLLPGDGLHGVAQLGGVVQANVGDNHRLGGRDDIGGVQAATHSGLQHHDVTAPTEEELQGHTGHQLKLRGVLLHLVGQPSHPGRDGGQLVSGDLLPVHCHPLFKVMDIGRGVQARGVASGGEHRGQHGRRGALAVGAHNVNELELLLRVTHGSQQLPGARKAGAAAQPGKGVDILHCLCPCGQGRVFVHKNTSFARAARKRERRTKEGQWLRYAAAGCGGHTASLGGSPLVLFVRRTTPRPAGTVSPIKGSITRAHLLCLFDCQCTPILTKLQEKKPTPALGGGSR